MNTRTRIVLVAQIVSQLCNSPSQKRYREIISSKKDTIINVFASILTTFLHTVSDECILHCLSALAFSSTNNEVLSHYLNSYPSFVDSMDHLLKNPIPLVKILASKVLTNIRSFSRLPRDLNLKFR